MTDFFQGSALLQSPYHNKGSAFSPEEREAFKLYGLLPPNVQTLEEQVKRAYQQYSSRTDALGKNTFMTSMKEQNEVLYYKVWTQIARISNERLIVRLPAAHPRPSERDVRHHLHTYRRRCSAEFLPHLSKA